MKSDTTSTNDSTAETIFSNINSRSNNKKKVIKAAGVLAVLLLLTITNLYSSEKNLRRSITLDRRSSSGGSLQTTTAAATATTLLEFHHESLDSIVNETNQVFVTMPAKAAGSSMKRFNKNCMNHSIVGNVINSKTRIEKIVTDSFQSPSIIVSHLRNTKSFIDLVKGSTRDTLIIHLHREELSRVRSAIQTVLFGMCTNVEKTKAVMNRYHFDVEVNATNCIIDEEHLINIIKDRNNEIGYGASDTLLSCNFFAAIEQNSPSNLVFVHYKQANQVQQILAKHHCPHILKSPPIASNTAGNKRNIMQNFIRLQADPSREVTFEEWFDKKQNIILWALGLKRKMNCQSKVIDMEDHLFSCPDEAVTLHRGVYQCVSMSEERY